MQVPPSITPAAGKFLRRMLRLSGLSPAAGMRLIVRPGGCSGLDAQYAPLEAPQAGDEEVVADGIRIFLPPESARLLEGVTIDFIDSPTQTGFAFLNAAGGACGCSTAAAPAVTRVAVGSIRRAATGTGRGA